MRILHFSILFCFLSILAGCGTKGPLVKPAGQPSPPILGGPTTTPGAESRPDNSNATKPAQ